MKQAQFTLDKINQCIKTLGVIKVGHQFKEIDQLIYDIRQDFIKSMEDDLKISSVISLLLANVKKINRLINQNQIDPECARKLIDCFKDINKVLKVFNFDKRVQYNIEIKDLIKQRECAREQKKFKLADEIREQLTTLGVDTHDKKVN